MEVFFKDNDCSLFLVTWKRELSGTIQNLENESELQEVRLCVLLSVKCFPNILLPPIKDILKLSVTYVLHVRNKNVKV